MVGLNNMLVSNEAKQTVFDAGKVLDRPKIQHFN